MDHNEAVRLQAVEKYVLGELAQPQRDEYEEHYFDCAECALDIKALAAFADTSRKLAGEESLVREVAPAPAGWFRWLRPAFAVPAFAALLILVAYQNTVTIPRAKEAATHGTGQLFTSSVSLQMANTRGGDEVKVQVPKNESFAFKFDFTPSRKFDSYIGQLQDASGRPLLQVNIPGSFTNMEAELAVPAGLLQPGKYALVFAGDPGSKGPMSKDEVLRLAFSVEFLP